MIFRKYSYDKNFFQTWSRDLSYVLGFTFADGNIYKTSLSYSISQKDIDILKYIKKCLKTNAPIEVFERKNRKNRSTYKVCRIRISSIDLTRLLFNKYNLEPNKTQTASVIFNIPEKLKGDFIRGFFDGDGWVYNRRNGVESGFCTASEQLIKNLHNLCGNIGRLRTRNVKGRKLAKIPLYSIELGTSDSIKLRDLMYQNEPFCLQRKKNRFWNFYIPSKRWWTKKQIDYLKNNYNSSLKQLSKKIHKSQGSILNKKFKLGLCPKKPNDWKWTKQEDNIIKTNTVNKAIKIIGRTRNAILARRHKFGILEIKPWEDNKIKFLMNNWFRSRKWLSQQINESENRIKVKIMSLRRLGKIPKRKIGRPSPKTTLL